MEALELGMEAVNRGDREKKGIVIKVMAEGGGDTSD